ncbi:MAG: DinB family protein [Chitinophagaceae bacterium]
MELIETLTNSFHIHNNINLYLLEAIAEKHLAEQAVGKGRNVGEQLAHMHNVRLMWLSASAPELMEGLAKIEKGSFTKKLLGDNLLASGKAIEALLQKCFAEGRIKGFKPHPAAFLGYLISHESHHRGQIMLALKLSGHPVDKKVQFGLWEWGSRG